MSDEIIQGDWDDLVARHDLHGRKVRVIVLDEQRPDTDTPGSKACAPGPTATSPWVRGGI